MDLAELLDVVTDCLKIVRIRAWNVPRVHGHKHLDDDASLSSLCCSRKATVSHARWARVPSCWNTKHYLRTTCECLAVASKHENCRYSMPSSLWHQIWAIWL